MIKCCIFDLDGVIVDTAKYHYLAWKKLANQLGFDFTLEQGEDTKGVSRMVSLDIVLGIGGMADKFTSEEKEAFATQKNNDYLEYVNKMTSDEILIGVTTFLEELKSKGIKVVLGSASKNAGVILDRCQIRGLFDVIVDGTMTSKAKPDPEVFSMGGKMVGIEPESCVVFEDAQAGVEAATRAGMRSIGIGGSPSLSQATMQLLDFDGFTLNKLIETID